MDINSLSGNQEEADKVASSVFGYFSTSFDYRIHDENYKFNLFGFFVDIIFL